MGVRVLSACGDKIARAPKPICAHRSQNSRSYGRYRARRRRSAEIVFTSSKVTAAAAARATPPASRPKFTRYSTVPSFATFKKSHAPPFFDPPCLTFSHTSLCFACRIVGARDKWSRRPFVATSDTSLPGSPALLVRCARPPPTSSICSQLSHVSTCTHGMVLSGPVLHVLKVRVLCRLFALSGPRAILLGTMQARGRGSAGKWFAICSCLSR
jgi:hypothetical protein